MKQREIAKLIAENIVDDIYEAVREATSDNTQAAAVMSQIKSILKNKE